MYIDKLKRDHPGATMDEGSKHRLENAITFFVDETGNEFSDKDRTKIIKNLPSKLPFDNIFIQLRKTGIWAVAGKDCIYTASFIDDKRLPMSLSFIGDKPGLFFQGMVDEQNNISGFRVKGKTSELLPTEYAEFFKTHQVSFFMSHLRFVRPFLEILSCKNIRTREVAPGRKKKYHKKPLFSYYVLQIQTSKNKHFSSEPQHLWSNRVHLCRGHVKTYTKDKPLFGTYVGNVWCPPHARGNKEKGIIAKDYAIKAAQL